MGITIPPTPPLGCRDCLSLMPDNIGISISSPVSGDWSGTLPGVGGGQYSGLVWQNGNNHGVEVFFCGTEENSAEISSIWFGGLWVVGVGCDSFAGTNDDGCFFNVSV